MFRVRWAIFEIERRKGTQGPLVFITTSLEMVVDIIEYHPENT